MCPREATEDQIKVSQVGKHLMEKANTAVAATCFVGLARLCLQGHGATAARGGKACQAGDDGRRRSWCLAITGETCSLGRSRSGTLALGMAAAAHSTERCEIGNRRRRCVAAREAATEIKRRREASAALGFARARLFVLGMHRI